MTRDAPRPPSAMGQAAIFYARRGWPVFPCRERDESVPSKRPGEAPRVFKAKAPYTPKGLKDATTDPHQIKLWWTRWPDAMIGLPMGLNGCFALDFDPRVDEATGEVFTLERLKGELEAMIGGPLPVSLAAVTPSDGVHVYLAQPAEGEPIRNRGNLPRHVDVRGHGGYVIAPPSIIHPGTPDERKYRFLRGKWDAEVEQAPERLIEVLRSRKTAPAPEERPRGPARPMPADMDEAARDAVRKYALSGLDAELKLVRSAGSGRRNAQLNESALKIASLVAAGALDETVARASLEAAARDNPGNDDDRQLLATIASGWSAGTDNPRDLAEIAAAARERAARPRRQQGSSSRARSPSPAPAPPFEEPDGQPSSRMGENAGGGRKKGCGGALDEAGTRENAFRPLTDLGNLERFLARHGADFLFVEAWGWLAWDGQRWNRERAVPLLGRAVQHTLRAIQEEADYIRASGVPFPPEGGFIDGDPDLVEDEDDRLFKESKTGDKERRRKTMLWLQQRALARRTGGEGQRHDGIVQIKSNGDIVLLSDKIAAWGRTSEGAGHIGCIDKLAQPELAALPSEFDADPLLVNLRNGTLEFSRPQGPNVPATVALREHRRDDRMTKVGNAAYDRKAACPLYDAFLEKVQPAADMRDFLDTWAGYSMLGLADAQKMAVFYGEGSNGKGVWVNVKAHILGDYAWSTGIETFMDAGRTRKGSDASPDLAALAGRRMVYANEPEDQSKFADGLVKSLTSDEPKGGVRELLRPPFELQITFNNTIMANNLPRISTDHGIQRRVQIVPWGVIIPDAEQDLRLKDKLKAVADGILNRMVKGALRYLDAGLALPDAVKEATKSYQAENDLLGAFLLQVVARVEGESVKARPFHRIFAAWQTWAGKLPQSGKPWSERYLAQQMEKKGFKKGKSSSMVWEGIACRYSEGDFVTVDEKDRLLPRDEDLPAPRIFPGEEAAPAAPPPPPPPNEAGSLPRDDYDDPPF